MFKQNWEKSSQRVSIDEQKVRMAIAQALPSSRYRAHEILSEGCGNLNIKVKLDGSPSLLILRFYLRDSQAARREEKLAQLLHAVIPIPQFLALRDDPSCTCALIECKPGITLREYLLHKECTELPSLMQEAGSLLAKIHAFRFPQSGFFDENLHIARPLCPEDLLAFAQKCLGNLAVCSQLKQRTVGQIDQLFQKLNRFLPQRDNDHLVHGDYDPANILVDNESGKWKISAILDWEFAFSGSTLWDVANMLRYAHQMPIAFEEAFLDGLCKKTPLPQGWRISIYLLNLISLLDLLTRSDPHTQPIQCREICALIYHFCQQLENSSL